MLNVGGLALLSVMPQHLRHYFKDMSCEPMSHIGTIKGPCHMVLLVLEMHSERHRLSFKVFVPDLGNAVWFLGHDLGEVPCER